MTAAIKPAFEEARTQSFHGFSADTVTWAVRCVLRTQGVYLTMGLSDGGGYYHVPRSCIGTITNRISGDAILEEDKIHPDGQVS